MSKVVLLALLLSLSLCLHVDHQHQSSQHLEPVESLNDTIETLEAIQSNLTSSIDGSFLGDGELVQFLENVIKSNVDDLYNFEVETIPVVALNPHVCSNLSQENKQRLVEKFEVALNNVQKLVSSVENIQNATLKESLLRRANLQYLYLEQVKQGIEKNCEEQIIAPTAYFYNLNVDNWIYGSSANGQSVIQTYNILSQQGTVTTCPLEKPFVASGSTECFDCQGENPVFDLSLQQCVRCPNQQQVDSNQHQCV